MDACNLRGWSSCEASWSWWSVSHTGRNREFGLHASCLKTNTNLLNLPQMENDSGCHLRQRERWPFHTGKRPRYIRARASKRMQHVQSSWTCSLMSTVRGAWWQIHWNDMTSWISEITIPSFKHKHNTYTCLGPMWCARPHARTCRGHKLCSQQTQLRPEKGRNLIV